MDKSEFPASNACSDPDSPPTAGGRFQIYGWIVLTGTGLLLLTIGIGLVFLLIPQGNRIAWDMALPSSASAACLLIGGILTGKGLRGFRSAGLKSAKKSERCGSPDTRRD